MEPIVPPEGVGSGEVLGICGSIGVLVPPVSSPGADVLQVGGSRSPDSKRVKSNELGQLRRSGLLCKDEAQGD